MENSEEMSEDLELNLDWMKTIHLRIVEFLDDLEKAIVHQGRWVLVEGVSWTPLE
jgi:hypothetical protein